MDTHKEILHVDHNAEQAVQLCLPHSGQVGNVAAEQLCPVNRPKCEPDCHLERGWVQVRQGSLGLLVGAAASGRGGLGGGLGFFQPLHLQLSSSLQLL